MMMMYQTMPYGPLLWIVAGMLLALLLVLAVNWRLTSLHNRQKASQKQAAKQLQDSSQPYEQGYQSAEHSPEADQEGENSSSSLQPQYEQPIARYPQEMPPRQ